MNYLKQKHENHTLQKEYKLNLYFSFLNILKINK